METHKHLDHFRTHELKQAAEKNPAVLKQEQTLAQKQQLRVDMQKLMGKNTRRN